METRQDHFYTQGKRATWIWLLNECLHHLGYEQYPQGRLVLEREETLAALRQVCAMHGDNDWPDERRLGEVVEKHLWPHLEVQAALKAQQAHEVRDAD